MITNIPTNISITRQYYSIVIDNGVKWAEAGYGGYITNSYFQFINPTPGLSSQQVEDDMRDLIAFANSVNATIDQQRVDSFVEWFEEILLPVNPVSLSSSF